jgi:hypothetical protein
MTPPGPFSVLRPTKEAGSQTGRRARFVDVTDRLFLKRQIEGLCVFDAFNF